MPLDLVLTESFFACSSEIIRLSIQEINIVVVHFFKGAVLPGPTDPHHLSSGQPNSELTVPVLGLANSGSQPPTLGIQPLGVLPLRVPPQANIRGSNSTYVLGIVEWSFVECQSNI